MDSRALLKRLVLQIAYSEAQKRKGKSSAKESTSPGSVAKPCQIIYKTKQIFANKINFK